MDKYKCVSQYFSTVKDENTVDTYYLLVTCPVLKTESMFGHNYLFWRQDYIQASRFSSGYREKIYLLSRQGTVRHTPVQYDVRTAWYNYTRRDGTTYAAGMLLSRNGTKT